jgi:hypothetical protein
MSSSAAHLLARHDLRRLRVSVMRPRAGALIGMLIPALLLLGALWVAGEQARFPATGVEGGALLGVLLAAVPAFLAYGVLFRPADDGFLRRLGLAPHALAGQRALRLLLFCLAAALATLVPALRAGDALARPVALGLAAALAGWALALLAFGRAAYLLSRPGGRRTSAIWKASGGWDPELGRNAPLVYAPLVPLLGTPLTTAWVAGAPGAGWMRLAAMAAVAALLAAWALRPLAAALPRFSPRALEMAFEPVPDDQRGALVHDRGIARLLPRRVALARARDSLVGHRRFGWATRVVWPVAIVAVVALGRWGEQPQVRGWVAAMAGGVLLLQALAVVGLGRLEREGRRWVDRSLGRGRAERLLGRWAWAVGMATWLLVPLALAWGAWVPGQTGWAWVGIAAATGLAASAASLAAAGR